MQTTPARRIITTVTPPVNIVDVSSDSSLLSSSTVLNKISVTLQNVSTNPVFIGLGVEPTSTSYHFILSADTSATVGNGAVFTTTEFYGAISGACSTGLTGKICVLELRS